MIIDIHTHIFPDAMAKKTIAQIAGESGLIPFTQGSRQELLDSMEKNEIRCSVNLPVATRPGQFNSINLFAHGLNEAAREQKFSKIISFGAIHPESSNYKEELRELSRMGFQGIKLHPDYQNMMFDDIRYLRILDAASELGLVQVVHAGKAYENQSIVHATPKQIKHVIRQVEPEKLVMAHFGGFGYWDEVEELLVGENVYFDTAYILKEIEEERFLRILRAHGSNKVLFGSDLPWGGQAESLAYINKWALTDTERKNILYENASSLLNLAQLS
ncbi:MAG: uncharacterized protein PWP24_1735 [Clostridiales bacterium]|nr:uncharacterized protein [Clostridiales bacterium]